MNQTISDLERNNKTAMKAHFVNSLVMFIFCALQSLSGLRTGFYALITFLLGLGPVALEYYYWRKDHETPLIKHLVAIGFAIFYTFALFTSFNNMVYVFVIPMILVVTIYNDAKYTLIINVGTVLESFLFVILGAVTGGLGYIGRDYAIIQVVIMILIGIYSYSTAKTSNENAMQKVENMAQAQSQTEMLLHDISNVSAQMKSGIEAVYTKLEILNHAAEQNRNAMQEVSAGSTDTASAVQNQLSQTHAIQEKVDIVNTASDQISENMAHTLSIIEDGNQTVTQLVEKVHISVSHSKDAATKLETLNNYMEEMHSIVELINGITSQTSLLALNASIEAARAGEAGKGFSVVATEISAMANQTKDATVNITSLIENVSGAIHEVVEVIHQMIEDINEEKAEASNTVESFSSIQENTLSIRDNITSLSANIEDLMEANRAIADSIQTISAISEEVSAHANETMAAEEQNSEVLAEIDVQMQDLVELINRES